MVMLISSARSTRSDMDSDRTKSIELTGRTGSRASIMKILKSGRNSDRTTGRSTGATTIERLRPILTKRAQRLACLEFFMLIVFMVGFIFLVWLHEDIERVYSLEHIMQIQMTKQFGDHSYTFDDINDVHEVWEFIDLSLIPTVVKHKDEVGHFLPHEEWGFLAYYNRVIGGIRFVQERSKDKPCEYQRLDEFYGNCQPLHTHNHHSFGYPACEGNYTVTDDDQTDDHADDHTDDLVDDASVSYNITACYHPEDYEGAVDFYHDEGFTMDEETKRFELWVDLFDDEEVIQKRVKYLKDRHWLDRETKSVSIEFLVYNGQDEPLICKVVLKFDFDRVGYVKPSTDIETIPLSPYFHLGWLKIAFEVFYVLIIINLITNEVREVYDKRKLLKRKERTLLKAFKKHYWEDEGSSGNMIDILNIGIGIALCIEWLLLVQHIRDVEVGMKKLHRPSGQVKYDDNDADIWSEYHHDVIEIEHATQLAVENMIVMRSLSVFVVYCMIFQMFKVWEGIPSLQGVSDTIVIAGKGLMSFSLVIICLVTLFAGAGMLAFGQQMEEFHDISSAFKNTLLIMTKGEATIYERQYEIDPVFSSVWHWLLVCIMYLVCLNLVLCILVDAYGEAHSAHENADRLTMPTLMEQTYDTVVYYANEVWFGFKFKINHGPRSIAPISPQANQSINQSEDVPTDLTFFNKKQGVGGGLVVMGNQTPNTGDSNTGRSEGSSEGGIKFVGSGQNSVHSTGGFETPITFFSSPKKADLTRDNGGALGSATWNLPHPTHVSAGATVSPQEEEARGGRNLSQRSTSSSSRIETIEMTLESPGDSARNPPRNPISF